MKINSYFQREQRCIDLLIRKLLTSKRHALAKKPAVTAFLTTWTGLKIIEH